MACDWQCQIVPLCVDKISYFFLQLAGTQNLEGHAPQTTFQGVCFNQDVIMRHWELAAIGWRKIRTFLSLET